MKNQRIYWIKHPVDYYQRDEIQIIQSLGVEGYAILGLYDQLVLTAAKNDGEVLFLGHEKMEPEQMSILFRIPVEVVKKGLVILERYHMIVYREDGAITIPNLDEFVGSETVDAARKREERREKRVSDTGRTMSGQCPKDKEKEKDIDIEKKERVKKEKSVETTDLAPTEKEVADYIAEKKYKVDPAVFVRYYAARGWRSGKTNVISYWREFVELWHVRNRDLRNPKGGIKVQDPEPGTMVDNNGVKYMVNEYTPHETTVSELDALLNEP